MTEGPLLGSMIRYVLPVIATGVLQLLFNAADLVVVGRFCGSNSVAAVGATGSLTVLLVNFFMGISVGGGVTVAQALGGHNDQKVRETVHTAIPLAMIFGAFISVLGICGSEFFLTLMDTPEKVLPLSALYMRIYFCGMVPHLVYNYGAAILRAAGDTRSPLRFLTLAGVLNVCLNVFFVTVIKLDVAGVALATAASQALSAVLVLRALMKREDACRFSFQEMRIRKEPLLKMLRLGIPAGINNIMFSLANVLTQSSVNSFGDVAVAGNAAATSIGGFVYTTMNSFHQTALNFTGQCVGAKKYDRVKRIFGLSLICVVIAGLITGGAANLFGKPLLSIYITDSPAAVEMGMIRLRVVCLFYFLCGMQEVAVGVIRGMGASVAPMIASLFGVCVLRIGWILVVFRWLRTLQSLYFTFPLSWIVVFCIDLIILFVLFKRRRLQHD